VISKPGALAVSDVPDPAPLRGQVVVEVGACGICGTDLHIADGEFPPTPYPIVPGHEFAGHVVELGPGLRAGDQGLEIGTRVAVDPSLFCGHCEPCRAGHGNLCSNWAATGDTVDGAFARYVAVPAANAYVLPDHLDYQSGALVEPLSCAVHGMRRLGPVLGATVLLAGAGPMGLLLVQLALRAGAGRIVVLDRSASRLEVALALGASQTTRSFEDLGDERFEVAIDATGVPSVIESAFEYLARGGRLLVFGVAPGTTTVRLSPFRIYNDEVTIVGSMAVLHSFGAALSLLADGGVQAGPLLSHFLPLEDFAEALALVRAGQGIKIQVSPALSR
jgi:2-desacetyl-2-hydroxyethyl bacteriochlorophyllide A dehydrogenase